MEERLQKFLASAGVASRRKAEALILEGRVKVNQGVVRQLGTKVDPARDLVTVDGRLVSAPDSRAYYLLYKPPGCVTTASDPDGRPTAFEYLRKVPERVFSVGRLDWDAEGAVLFTNDGELANRLAHPRYGHRRVYLVKVKGDPEPEALRRMAEGVRLDDGPAKALEVAIHERAEKNVWIRVVVGEGRFHLVKRLCEAVGLQVQRLFRPEFGGVTVQGLRPGTFRALSPQEIRAMKQSVDLAPGEAAPPLRQLPRAARRHGHGPPAPPPTAAELREREAARAEEDDSGPSHGRPGAPEVREGRGSAPRDRDRGEAASRGGRGGGARRDGGGGRAGGPGRDAGRGAGAGREAGRGGGGRPDGGAGRRDGAGRDAGQRGGAGRGAGRGGGAGGGGRPASRRGAGARRPR
jgi:23S rRNA pseudouridine2605 synthase